MNCPHCEKKIHAFTGLQEIQKFQKHLAKCRKNPNNIVITDGRKTAIVPLRPQQMMEVMEIRAASGQ